MKKKKIILTFIIFILAVLQYSYSYSYTEINYSDLLNPSQHLNCVDYGSPLYNYSNYVAGKKLVEKWGKKEVVVYCDRDGVPANQPVYDYYGKTVCSTAEAHVKMGTHTYVKNVTEAKLGYGWENIYATSSTKFPYNLVDTIDINKELTIDKADYGYSHTKNIGVSDKEMARMAYIIASTNEWYKGNFYENKYSKKQMAIYRKFHSFISKFGYGSPWVNEKNYNFGTDSDAQNTVLQEAEAYAEKIIKWKENGTFTDETDSSVKDSTGKVTTELYEYNSKPYLKVGPLKWNFSGEIGSININNDKEIKAGRYENEKFKIDNCSNIIKSGKSFWLLIPANKGVNNLKIDLNINSGIKVYGAEIKLLQGTSISKTVTSTVDGTTYTSTYNLGPTQNLIQSTGWSKEIPPESKTINYTLDLKKLALTKIDKKTGIKIKEDVKFKLKYQDNTTKTEFWVKRLDNGTINYVAENTNATIFCFKDGNCTIKNLVRGQYELYEIENDNNEYIKPDPDERLNVIDANGVDKKYIKIIDAENIYKVPNKKRRGALKIVKKDEKTEIPLKGVQFKLLYKCKDGKNEDGTDKYRFFVVIQDKDGKISYKTRNSAVTVAEDVGTTFTTNANGEIILENLDIGEYLAVEISRGENTNYQIVDENVACKLEETGKSIMTVVEGKTGKYTITNKKKTGDLGLYKRDVYNKAEPLKGVQFKLVYKAKDGKIEDGKHMGKDKYRFVVVQDKNGNISYKSRDYDKTVAEDAGTIFETDENGYIYIKDLDIGQYYLYEISNPNKKYNLKGTISINEGQDKDGNFGDIIVVSNKGETYRSYRTYNEKNPEDIVIKGTVWTPNKEGKDDTSITDNSASIYNKDVDYLLKNIKVELYTNGEYKVEKTENGTLKNIYMKEIDQKLIATTTTDENGNYEFVIKGIRYPELQLPYYKIVFRYEGMDFIACNRNYQDTDLPDTNKINGINIGTSKASENYGRRKLFNNKYATIAGTNDNQLEIGRAIGKIIDNGTITEPTDNEFGIGNAIGGVVDNNTTTGINKNEQGNINGAPETTLTYNYNNKKSTVNNVSVGYITDVQNKMITINQGNLINEILSEYNFADDFDKDKSKGERLKNERTYYEKDDDNEIKEVKRVNLALIRREMPDLQVTNQIENVVTTINGYNNLYKTTFNKTNTDPNNSDLKVGVSYVVGSDENEAEGKLAAFKVYPSDVQTWADNSMQISSKLQVYITYKIAISNNAASELYNKVNELAIYYDNNYELQFIGDKLDETKSNYCAEANYQVKESKYSNYNMEGYTKACIEVDGIIENGKTKNIYVTYKVKDAYVKGMLEQEVNAIDKTLRMKNIAEINAYSTYSDKEATKSYAGVDRNSAPGNMTDINKIDNDTGKAKEFTISQNGEDRTLTGTVFLDSSEVNDNERISNSIYESSESSEDKLLQGVKVKLKGHEDEKATNIVTGATATTYNKTQNISYSYDNLDGENTYKISGFIPGDYTIEYTYNNSTYYVEDGKKVNINAVDYKSAIVRDEDGKTKVKTAFKNQTNDPTKDTDWYKLDNPKKDGESGFTRYNEAVDDWEKRKEIDGGDKDFPSITATTPRMEISVELNTTSENNSYTPEGYDIVNMDFGITERPRQSLKLYKNISNLKVTLANGQIINDATISKNEEGKLKVKGSKKGITAGAATDIDRGFVKLELDSELIHSSTIEIVYDIKITNNSEKDYSGEDYYWYGEGKEEKNTVKITPGKIVDYTSNDLSFDQDTIVEYDAKDTIDNKSYGWSKITLDSNATDGKKYNEIIKKDQELYGNGTTKKSGIYTILMTDKLSEKELATGETSDTIKLCLTKLLSNTDEDMIYDNDVELITATNTGGRSLSTELGTYTFTSGTGIGASSEKVIITPPTGLSETNMISYVVLIIGLLSITASALTLVLIKRKK